MYQKRILVVDDASEIRALVSSVLQDAGYQNLYLASSYTEALAFAAQKSPDFALLDVMLPDGDGFTLAHELRKQIPGLPLMFLTAKDRPEDRVSGLTMGADDYLVKPFLPQELLLRLGAIMRRCYPDLAEEHILKLNFCTVNLDTAEVNCINGTTYQLTAKEHTLIHVLARNAGRIVTIDTLLTELWGPESFGYENSLMTHVRRLREKIEENPSQPTSLITIKGLGYRLNTM